MTFLRQGCGLDPERGNSSFQLFFGVPLVVVMAIVSCCGTGGCVP